MWEADRQRLEVLIGLVGSLTTITENTSDIEKRLTCLANVQAVVDSIRNDVLRVTETGQARQWETGYQQGLAMVNAICGLYPHFDGIPLGNHWVSLHFYDEELGSRQRTELVPVGGAIVTNDSRVEWREPSKYPTHVGVWTDKEGGDCLMLHPILIGGGDHEEGNDIVLHEHMLRVPY